MKLFDALETIRIGTISLATICSALLVLIICLVARKIVMKLLSRMIERTHLDGSLKSFLTAAASIVIWILVVLIVADSLNIPMTSLVALMSIVGLALSLSVQNLLENVFSGMTILATKPFGADDYVDIGGTAGTITSVGLFYTVMLTNDGKTIHMPNSTVTASKVVNYSVRPTRRVDLEVSASYDDKTETVKKALLSAAAETAGVVSDPAPFAAISEYGRSSIKYVLLAWVKTDSYLDIKFALTERVRESFAENGVTMTYDHINVHMTEK